MRTVDPVTQTILRFAKQPDIWLHHKGNPVDEEASALLLTAYVKMKAIQSNIYKYCLHWWLDGNKMDRNQISNKYMNNHSVDHFLT